MSANSEKTQKVDKCAEFEPEPMNYVKEILRELEEQAERCESIRRGFYISIKCPGGEIETYTNIFIKAESSKYYAELYKHTTFFGEVKIFLDLFKQGEQEGCPFVYYDSENMEKLWSFLINWIERIWEKTKKLEWI